ncbi:MAG TPA: ABC transporter substrate-binding protein [Saprospirales bacterium]|nr:ABC transporter substrate-binding protein [Saprospirales bacterium]
MRLTAVSYLNTKPFIYGLFRSDLAGIMDLSLDIPSICAQKLLTGEADIALAPVAVIPQLPQAYLISNYCIGATGAVKTVCLYSEVPLENIQQIYLDFHSRTSVALVQILCREYWHIQPIFIPATEGFEHRIGGGTAAVIIGDRTMGLEKKYPFAYDLGEAWVNWTGLPFVFAAWISTKPISAELTDRFNQALGFGLEHIPELLKIIPFNPAFDTESYFKDNISYDFNEAKWQGLHRFLGYLAGENNYKLYR